MARFTRFRASAVAAIVGVLALFSAACTPGSENAAAPPPTDRAVRTDIAALGPVTLTVWDQEVRGGQNEQMEQLNAAFHQRYPNVTIERVSRSFDDLATTLRLAITGNDAPDVVQANNGRADMGAFVAAGQLVPLRPYGAGLRLGRALPGVGAAVRELHTRRQGVRRGQGVRAPAGRRGRRDLLQPRGAAAARHRSAGDVGGVRGRTR